MDVNKFETTSPPCFKNASRLPFDLNNSMAVSSVNPSALLEQMTFEEKVSILGGESFFGTKSIPRLGIPSVKFTDGPNGARGGTINDGVKAACFPASVSLASTWDESLVYRVGVALAEETKTKSAVAVLAPTICPHRSPLGGRNFESFSEDPLLAGILASRYVEGLQDTGIGAVVKHYAANEQETMRRMINVVVGERALREIYLKPFEIVAKTANPWSIMTSYNRLNGHHADSSEYLLRHVLRDQWGYKGLTVSDWGGTNSTVESLNAGLDLEMPGPTVKRKLMDVQKAVDDGKIDPKVIDTSALRVLEFLVKTGKFESPDNAPERSVVDPEHSQLIRKAGADGIVLLRNENEILPLQREKVKSVALLGLAKECLAFGGGSAKVNCHYKITPYDAIQQVLAGTNAEVRYAKGAHTFRNFEPWKDDIYDIEGKPGLTLSRYGNRDLEGPPYEQRNVPSGSYRPNFQDSKSRDIDASFKLEGIFRPASSGKHNLGFSAMGLSKLFIDDELLFECGNNDDPVTFLLAVNGEEQRSYDFAQGQSYRIRLESKARLTDPQRLTPNGFFDGLLAARVGFMTQEAYEEDILPEAIEAAKASGVAIVFVGNTTDWETEGELEEPASRIKDEMLTCLWHRTRYGEHGASSQRVPGPTDYGSFQGQQKCDCCQLHWGAQVHALVGFCLGRSAGMVSWYGGWKFGCRCSFWDCQSRR